MLCRKRFCGLALLLLLFFAAVTYAITLMRPVFFEDDSAKTCCDNSDCQEILQGRELMSTVSPLIMNGNLESVDRRYEELRTRLERTARRVSGVGRQDSRELARLLVSDLRELWLLDGREAARARLATDTAALVQRRLRLLQNPTNCSAARRLVCPVFKTCGFGCTVHQASYCLIVAYATQRTLVFSSEDLIYEKTNWSSVLQPLSDTCTDTGGQPVADYPGSRNTLVLKLPVRKAYFLYTPFRPPAVPADLLSTIRMFHGLPQAWWVGQIISYLFRLEPNTAKLINDAFVRFNFTSPVVGIHIRRGDKLISEAKYHSVDEYMSAVEDYYETLEISLGPVVRKIYLASDDVTVFDEVQKKYPLYTIIGDPKSSKIAGGKEKYQRVSLIGMLMDIYMLARSDFLVCTLSSNVCRLVYEIMQTMHTDASMRITSLDLVYGYPAQKALVLRKAIMPHKARRKGEIDLRSGDLIAVKRTNENDTMSYGYNRNTKKKGSFPTFKTIEEAESVGFPIYSDA